MIDIHFTITEDEYLEAQKLYVKKNRKFPWVLPLIAVFVPCTIVVAFASSNRLNEVLRQFAPVFVFLLILLSFPLLRTWSFRKRFKKEKQNLTNAHLIMDDAGYHMDVPGIGGGVAEWGGMDGWLEGKSVFLLRSGLLMRIFPKSSLNEVQLSETRALLAEKLGPVGVMRKR